MSFLRLLTRVPRFQGLRPTMLSTRRSGATSIPRPLANHRSLCAATGPTPRAPVATLSPIANQVCQSSLHGRGGGRQSPRPPGRAFRAATSIRSLSTAYLGSGASSRIFRFPPAATTAAATSGEEDGHCKWHPSLTETCENPIVQPNGMERQRTDARSLDQPKFHGRSTRLGSFQRLWQRRPRRHLLRRHQFGQDSADVSINKSRTQSAALAATEPLELLGTDRPVAVDSTAISTWTSPFVLQAAP